MERSGVFFLSCLCGIGIDGRFRFRWFTWFNDLDKDKRLDKENPLDILTAGIEANPTRCVHRALKIYMFADDP